MDFTKGKNKEELLDQIRGGCEPGSKAFEQIRAAITVACAADIETVLARLQSAVEESSKASESLGRKVFWLNVVLTAATVVIAVGTCVMAFK